MLAHASFAIETSTFVLGDETASAHGRFAHRVINIRRLNWAPRAEDPDFLDLVCRTFQHADRVLLVFAHPQERIAWASFMRLTGINTELMEPQLAHIVPSGIGHWGGSPTLVVSRGPLSLAERVLKRAPCRLGCVSPLGEQGRFALPGGILLRAGCRTRGGDHRRDRARVI